MLGLQKLSTSRPTLKLSTKERNDQKWEIHKNYIRRIYMDTDHTLKETMKIVADTYYFTASERKWKDKLKEWNFAKNLSADDMSVLVAKCGMRKRIKGKETTFFYKGVEIKPEKFENFKKRKSTKIVEVGSPTAETPADITYYTPGPQTPFLPSDIETHPTLHQETAEVAESDYPAAADDSRIAGTGTQKTHREAGISERHMLIDTISPKSMLWDCPGRGLHTMDEESLFGADDDELLAPFDILGFIEDHITEARIDAEHYRTKSAVIKYLGATVLLIEKKYCSQDTFLEYLSEFLDVLEVGPGAFVSILLQESSKPFFRASEYSDVFALYREVLTLLRTEFYPPTQVVARICILFADLEMLYPEMSHHAEVLYGVAIESYERAGNFDQVFQCQLSQANALIDQGFASDAYELLAHASSKYLQDHLDLWVFGNKPTSTAYTPASLFSVSPRVQPTIFRLKHILDQKMQSTPKSGNRGDLYVMMIHEIASLGGILGSIWSVKTNQNEVNLHLEALGPLWSELFHKLSTLNDRAFGLLKAFAYLQRSNYLSDGVNPSFFPNSLEDIATAHRYLSDGGYFPARLLGQFVEHIQGLRLRSEHLPLVQVLDGLDIFALAGMSRDPFEVSRPSPSPTPELQPHVPEAIENADDLVNRPSPSRKYGVKYNDSCKKGLCFID